MKNIYFLSLLVVLLFSFVVSPVFASNLQDAFSGTEEEPGPLQQAGEGAGYETQDIELQGPLVVAQIIRTVLSVIGILFLILMIYGGFLWMTDRGNEDQVKRAKNTITAAIIGLFVILAAYAITYFIIGRLGETTLSF